MNLTQEQIEKANEIAKIIKSQSEVIDEVIALSGQHFFDDNKDKENFDFEVIEGQNESYRFMGGNDVRYDRYVFPFNYTLWYLPKRINILLKPIIYAILKNESNEIVIIDLGAGTGAIQISVALVCFAMAKLSYDVPKITIHNIDLSPFMLNYGKSYIWKCFIQKYPNFENNVTFITKYHSDSWENIRIEKLENIETWLMANFLFDNSTSLIHIETTFNNLIPKHTPKTVITSTSGGKKGKMQEGLSCLETYFDKISCLPLKDKPKEDKVAGQIYGLVIPKYELKKTSLFREKLYRTHNIKGTGLYKKLEWQDGEEFISNVFIERDKWSKLPNDNSQEFSLVDVRPIFIFYETELELTNKFKLIFDVYSKEYQLDTITIIDKGDIGSHLKLSTNEESSNNLQVELLGRLYLLWNTQKQIKNLKVNTIIKENSGILVFAFSKENETNIKKINSCWDIPNIIFWDKKSKEKFLEFKKVIEVE